MGPFPFIARNCANPSGLDSPPLLVVLFDRRVVSHPRSQSAVPDFARKAGRILDLYARLWQAEPLHACDFVISADEKTSVQARRRKHASRNWKAVAGVIVAAFIGLNVLCETISSIAMKSEMRCGVELPWRTG